VHIALLVFLLVAFYGIVQLPGLLSEQATGDASPDGEKM
jgi:hypothetical protein